MAVNSKLNCHLLYDHVHFYLFLVYVRAFFQTDNQDETAKEQSKGHKILDSTKDENKTSEVRLLALCFVKHEETVVAFPVVF